MAEIVRIRQAYAGARGCPWTTAPPDDDLVGPLAFLRDAARRRDGADVVMGLSQLRLLRPGHPGWIDLLGYLRATWGEDGQFVAGCVVVRGRAILLEDPAVAAPLDRQEEG